jgi:late competence protein required for DNA uptake (superfamily II DNA/RNA helicase)
MGMHYKPTTWIDCNWKIRKSPIAEEAERWFEKIKPNTIRSFQSRCNTCGEMKYNGIASVLDASFKCSECMLMDKMDQLANDPKWVKQDRLFQMRHAREQHRLLAEANKSVEAAIKREQEATL